MNRRIRFLSQVAAAIAMFVVSASLATWADEPATPGEHKAEGWYLGASVGGVFAGGLYDQPFTKQNNSVTASSVRGFRLGSGTSLAALGGYQFDRARVEGEFLWQSYGRNATTIQVLSPGAAPFNFSPPGTRVDTYSVLVNGCYDFPNRTRFTPFVGAGVGVTWLDAATQTFAAQKLRTPGLSQSVFAYQAKAGVSYEMNASVAAFLQYRFTGTGGFRYGGATVTAGGQTFSIQPASGNLSNHALELGLRLRL